MNSTLKIIVPLCLTLLLSGCYCFEKISPTESSVRHLRTSKPYSLCENWGGNGQAFQLNAYYGFPMTKTAKTNYINKFVQENASDNNLDATGQFGVRMERYMPSVITPYAVLGIGIDYSQAFTKIQFANTNTPYINRYDLRDHRIMLSMNHMTWVRANMIGYLTLQGGLSQLHGSFSSDDPDLQNAQVKEPFEFAYRAGYGLQYYPKGPWGIAIEGGYGGGAYIRAGVFMWVF